MKSQKKSYNTPLLAAGSFILKDFDQTLKSSIGRDFATRAYLVVLAYFLVPNLQQSY
jgi:hypothetical protein